MLESNLDEEILEEVPLDRYCGNDRRRVYRHVYYEAII